MTGPRTLIEGRFGFLQAFLGEHADVEAVTAGLGEHWELPGIFFKPYPCNHFTHAGIDAALELRARGVRPEDIVAIELGVPSRVLKTIGQPSEAKARPSSGYHAAFSGPYTVAAALLGGGGLGVFHEDFTDEAARDETRLALAAKVRCVADEHCDRIFPHQFPAVLRVETADGTHHEVRVDTNRGGPDRPLSTEELATKLRLNASRVLDDKQAAAVANAGMALAGSPDVSELMALVRGGSQV